MNKIEIEVPINVRYISEWDDFPLQQLSTGHCIVNKTITGCGYTHYSLTNNQPIILCSPRKFLLDNKYEQLCKDFSIHLVINEGEKSLDVDGDDNQTITKKVLEELKSPENTDYISILEIENSIKSYIFHSRLNGITPKILVTYDSLKYVLNALGENINLFSIIVDEFQNIFIDSRFKAETELSFLSYLQSCPNVTYLSATPYIEEYLDELDEFKDLPYYELKWHSDRLQTIKIDLRKTFRPSQDIDKIIQNYLNEKFPEKVDEETGETHQSREVVFYTNSIKMISSTVIRNNLTPDQVNIICADTDKNKKSLKRAGLSIGKAPLKGEPHKMFTFCTRTTYAGADFYSTNALSVIVSDCRVDSLATDIRMDFPQIMGRQRLKENVFRDECIFIYKLSDESITMEEYDSLSRQKLRMTEQDIRNYNAVISIEGIDGASRLISDYRSRVKFYKYSGDYTGIDEKTGIPKINKLVMISERRAFELRCNIYKNDVLVYNEFSKTSLGLSDKDLLEKSIQINKLRTKYRSNGSFESKLKAVCEFLQEPRWIGQVQVSDLFWLPLSQRNYIIKLGIERLKALSYIESEIKRELENNLISKNPELIKRLMEEFIIGERYSLKDIKLILATNYSTIGLIKTAKASDLEDYFNIKKCTICQKDGKRINGYEIISLKS